MVERNQKFFLDVRSELGSRYTCSTYTYVVEPEFELRQCGSRIGALDQYSMLHLPSEDIGAQV